MKQPAPGRSRAAAVRTLAVLIAASACSFVDRQVMSLLVGPMKADLALSDTGVSLLLGLAFVLCFAIAGPPIGLLVDRVPRWRLLSAGIGFWTLATAACGAAGGFGGLFVARMGVGVGEATLNPCAYSLIPDVVPRRRLGLATAVFGLGVYVGAGVALIIGGVVVGLVTAQPAILLPVLGQVRSWQVVFLAVALLGIPISIIAFVMKEPGRGADGNEPAIPVARVLRYIGDNRRAMGALTLCWGGVLMAGYGVAAWFPTFMIRHYGWTPAQVGITFGVLVVLAGAPGAIVGGALSDAQALRRDDGRVRVVAFLALLAVPFAFGFPLVTQPNAAIALVAALTFLQAGAAAAAPSALQDVLPGRMRGFGSALALAATTVLGLGVGPLLIALATDRVFGDPARIGDALALVVPAMLIGAALAGRIAQPAYADLRASLTSAQETTT